MRPGEVRALTGEDVDRQMRFVLIPRGKTAFARRTIPLTERAYQVVGRWCAKGRLFPFPKYTVSHMHERLRRKLKLNFRLYDFQHTFDSRMAMAGVDLATTKELMGHSTIQMTMRYVHPTPEHKEDAMKKLESLQKSLQSETRSP